MAILRVHLMLNRFGYNDPAMGVTLTRPPSCGNLPGKNLERIPDESTILFPSVAGDA
jgi:hypothetical protein